MNTICVTDFRKFKSAMPGAYALSIGARVGMKGTLYENVQAVPEGCTDDLVETLKQGMFTELMRHIYDKEIKGT